MEPRLNLVTACGERYLPGVMALLGSLCSCGAEVERMRLVVLAFGLRPTQLRSLSRAAASLELPLDLCTPALAGIPRVPPAMLARFSIPRVLSGVTRALYVDADVVFLRCPTVLARAISPAAVQAVQDICMPYFGSPDGLCERYGGLDPRLPYFNSGVMLMDLDDWRRHGWGESAMRLARRADPPFAYPDQDAMNMVLRGRWAPLDRRWNVFPVTEMMAAWGLDELEGDTLSRPLLDALESEAHLVHYVTRTKPWDPGFPAGPNRDRWLVAYKQGLALAA